MSTHSLETGQNTAAIDPAKFISMAIISIGTNAQSSVATACIVCMARAPGLFAA